MRQPKLGPAAESVRLRLLEMLATGEVTEGGRLPGERELASGLGVSRQTVRSALAALERSGSVRRVPGRGGGTFAGAHKVARDLSRIVGVPTLLREQGFSSGSRVISMSVLPADSTTSRALGLTPGAFVVDLVRIRLADGAPISLEHSRYPAARFPGLPELPLGGSVYALLEEHFATVPARATERIEVVLAGATEARVLEVAAGTPLLAVTRTAYDADGEAIEFSSDLFRADRTRVVVTSTAGARAELSV